MRGIYVNVSFHDQTLQISEQERFQSDNDVTAVGVRVESACRR
jgi:hypothetical protein